MWGLWSLWSDLQTAAALSAQKTRGLLSHFTHHSICLSCFRSENIMFDLQFVLKQLLTASAQLFLASKGWKPHPEVCSITELVAHVEIRLIPFPWTQVSLRTVRLCKDERRKKSCSHRIKWVSDDLSTSRLGVSLRSGTVVSEVERQADHARRAARNNSEQKLIFTCFSSGAGALGQ